MRSPRSMSLVGVLVLLLLGAGSADATSIDPLIWQQLALHADFIGIVECDAAGGIVARYRIIETWKGEEKREHITVRVRPDPLGNAFPIALCGERFLITAYRRKDSRRLGQWE